MNSQFLKYLQDVWNNSGDYVISYMRGANKVKVDADLTFLIELRVIEKTL